MPLTNTLETARRIEALGFTHQQAQGFAELLEDTAHATQQDLKDFIREQIGTLDRKLDAQEEKLAGKLDAQEEKLAGKLDAQEEKLAGKLGAQEEKLAGKLDALEGRINVRFAEQEARFEHSLRMQLATILTAIIGVVGLAVAIIKLFPNVH
jgi:DNA anti-recombination protein RmuC